MPEWLKKYYNSLWARYENKPFTFKEVVKELGISKVMSVKILWELEKRGFVNKERSETDYRARVYRLISPDDIGFVIGIYSLVEKEKIGKQSLIEKFLLINEKLSYALTGSHAAYYYHRYMFPPKVFEIKVKPGDEGKWIAFLTDEQTRVFISDVIEKRKISNYVKLLHSIFPIDLIRAKTKEGYYIERPEFLLIELLERQTQTSMIEATAIILRKKNELKWFGENGIITLAEKLGISRRFGFLLDAINFESIKPLIKEEVIEEVKKNVKGKSSEIFPMDDILYSRLRELRNKLVHQALLTSSEKEELREMTEMLEGYKSLSEKWGLKVLLPREAIRKVLDDFGVKLAKK
ncbi:MAG: helix-turn-helix domain-containing protein [Candidatus Bathyarchaeia archaeon]